MRSHAIARLIILGSVAIFSTLFIQFYIIYKQENSEERLFKKRVVTSLYNVARKVVKSSNQLAPTNDLIKEKESNYFIVNVNSQINANTLHTYLKSELLNAGLGDERYEYGIYDCDRDSMVFNRFVSLETEQRGKRVVLPVYKDFIYYFGVRFVDRKINPFYDYTWLSLGLLFLVLVFFVYSLWVILKQRTLAEMQKDFINNLTHEFKTPIAAVSISSDVLLQNDLINENPRLKQYTQIIKSQNELLNTQVERVLQVARMEKTHFQINHEPVDTHEIIGDLVASVEPRVKAKNGEINLSLEAMAPVIMADKIHFIHVIQNILDNAIKYSLDSNVRLEISTYDVPGYMVIKCTDHGPGIPKEFHKKIFSRFYRVPTGNVHNVKGFGLGLHYVYQICKVHHWKIRVDSQVGIGTSLYIEIPK